MSAPPCRVGLWDDYTIGLVGKCTEAKHDFLRAACPALTDAAHERIADGDGYGITTWAFDRLSCPEHALPADWGCVHGGGGAAKDANGGCGGWSRDACRPLSGGGYSACTGGRAHGARLRCVGFPQLIDGSAHADVLLFVVDPRMWDKKPNATAPVPEAVKMAERIQADDLGGRYRLVVALSLDKPAADGRDPVVDDEDGLSLAHLARAAACAGVLSAALGPRGGVAVHLVSARSERWLRKQSVSGRLQYRPGAATFRRSPGFPPAGPAEGDAAAACGACGGTGVEAAVAAAVACNPPCLAYPVTSLQTLQSVGWEGRAAPPAPAGDCLVLHPSSAAEDVVALMQTAAAARARVRPSGAATGAAAAAGKCGGKSGEKGGGAGGGGGAQGAAAAAGGSALARSLAQRLPPGTELAGAQALCIWRCSSDSSGCALERAGGRPAAGGGTGSVALAAAAERGPPGPTGPGGAPAGVAVELHERELRPREIIGPGALLVCLQLTKPPCKMWDTAAAAAAAGGVGAGCVGGKQHQPLARVQYRVGKGPKEWVAVT
jgi:hypothetical protein